MFWVIFHAFLASAERFWKNLLESPSECQTVWIQIRPDIWSGLIQGQTACKVVQQMTIVSIE